MTDKRRYKMPRIYGKDKSCPNCGEMFKLTAPNKKFCSRKCKDDFRYGRGKKSSTVATVNNPETMQVKYDVSNGIKFLTKLAELAEKVVDHFSILRLETYSQATQNAALELMIHLDKFLRDQIRGGNVIET